MNELFKQKLVTLKEFQDKYPTSHVGGSIGLFLRGINLLRDLSKSDLDITIDEMDIESEKSVLKTYEETSDNNDFDLNIKKVLPDGHYVKIDIRICPEPSFDVIEFEGVSYNVSKYRDIIFWKQKYAKKEVIKHRDDLETIKTGVRPLTAVQADDLPF